jgi:hypothetical protein
MSEVSSLQRLLILIPTRNRHDLAINAINSALESEEQAIEVIVSDNSTNSVDVEKLSAFVAQRGDRRLLLHRPPSPLSMTLHWNWAIGKAYERTGVSHLAILTDRMMFKHNALTALLTIVAKRPASIISYNHDRVVDHRQPIRAELQAWTDDVLTVHSNTLLELSSKCVFPQALPRLLNCVTPIALLTRIVTECGTFVDSVSPDYNFCYRALSMVSDIIYWDRAPIFHYALGRSNGESTARGVETPDNIDFLKTNGVAICSRAPVAGVRTLTNAMLHEYIVARDEMRSDSFPPIDKQIYIDRVESELSLMENAYLSSKMTHLMDLYREHEGLMRQPTPITSTRMSLARHLIRRSGIGHALLRVRQRMVQFFASGLDEGDSVFGNLESALSYARSHDGERVGDGAQHLIHLKAQPIKVSTS